MAERSHRSIRVVIHTNDNNVYYGRYDKVTDDEYKQVVRLVQDWKKMTYLTIYDSDENEMIFNPAFIKMVLLEKEKY